MTQPVENHTQPDQSEASDKESRIQPPNPSLADEFLQFIDKFNEDVTIASFHCYALTLALADRESMDKDVFSGAQRCSDMLLSMLRELKISANQVHDRFVAEHKPDRESPQG